MTGPGEPKTRRARNQGRPGNERRAAREWVDGNSAGAQTEAAGARGGWREVRRGVPRSPWKQGGAEGPARLDEAAARAVGIGEAQPMRRQTGLTYIEMLLVVAIVALLATGVLPMVHHRVRHQKEIDLKAALREMRQAIDLYAEYAAYGQIEPWDLDWNGYPEDLEMLVEGAEVKESAETEPVVIKFLRRIPVDPMTGEADWDCRGYRDDPDDRSGSCDDLYDVYSRSPDQALDGSYYKDW